jgi:hypothetical protein
MNAMGALWGTHGDFVTGNLDIEGVFGTTHRQILMLHASVLIRYDGD